jgi:hypothetical protein
MVLDAVLLSRGFLEDLEAGGPGRTGDVQLGNFFIEINVFVF